MRKILIAFLLANFILLWTGCEKDSEYSISTMIDSRDGEVYTIVTIRNQTWMAENLRYNTPGSWENPRNPSPIYGRLYDWDTAMIACPSGWHLPSDSEWNNLEIALGLDVNLIEEEDRGFHAKSMKSVEGWEGNENGNNLSMFNVYPAGVISYGMSFFRFGNGAYIWTATIAPNPGGARVAWCRGFSYGDKVGRGTGLPTDGFSCRCVKD
jgi:uncharacterized protein (TIGR02145 family)